MSVFKNRYFIWMQTTEIVKEAELLRILSSQVMIRVDEDNEEKPLLLNWV